MRFGYAPNIVALSLALTALISGLPCNAMGVTAADIFPHTEALVEHDDLAEIVDSLPTATAATMYIDDAREWNLLVCGPIVWVDSDGTEHEVSVDKAEWKGWIDHLGSECVNAWPHCGGRPECPPNGSITVGVQLMSQKHKVGKLVYTPEQGNKAAAPFSDMVSDITGISSGKPLSKVLPPEAKKATMVYFSLRFMRAVPEQQLSTY